MLHTKASDEDDASEDNYYMIIIIIIILMIIIILIIMIFMILWYKNFQKKMRGEYEMRREIVSGKTYVAFTLWCSNSDVLEKFLEPGVEVEQIHSNLGSEKTWVK